MAKGKILAATALYYHTWYEKLALFILKERASFP